MTVTELIGRVNEILKDIPDRDFDGMCIMEDIAGVSRERAALHGDDELSQGTCSRTLSAAHRRAVGYPLQYILGKWEFYGLPFKVGEGVLIPRADTEILVETALSLLKKTEGELHIVDLCCGSGCIAVALSKNLGDRARVYGVEISGEAFPYLSENIRMNGADVRLLRGDVMNGSIMENFRIEGTEEYIPVDCIICNPPYLTDEEMASLQTEVTHEPENALYGGPDGLKYYRVIICLWKEILREGGLMIFETGSEQTDAVCAMLKENGFGDIFTERDCGGNLRVAGGYKRAE